MISESMIVMVLLGCGNQLQSCDYIGTQSAGWTSVSECKDAIPVTIKQYQAAPYPVISARCGKEKLQRKDFARVVGDHSNHTTEGKILAIEGFEDFGGEVEQPNPESFRACLRYLQEEALSAGFLFPGHLIGVAAEAMDCFVEDHKASQGTAATAPVAKATATGHA